MWEVFELDGFDEFEYGVVGVFEVDKVVCFVIFESYCGGFGEEFDVGVGEWLYVVVEVVCCECDVGDVEVVEVGVGWCIVVWFFLFE